MEGFCALSGQSGVKKRNAKQRLMGWNFEADSGHRNREFDTP
jgi:hypothetical protein